MSDERNWLADDLKRTRKSRKRLYIGGAISVGLIIVTVLIVYADSHNKGVNLANKHFTSQNSSLSTAGIPISSNTKQITNSSHASPSSTSALSLPSVPNETQAEMQQAEVEFKVQEQEHCNAARVDYSNGLTDNANNLISEEKGIATNLQNEPLLSFSTELNILNEYISTANQYDSTLLYPQYEGTITSNQCSPDIPSPGEVSPCIATDYIGIGYCEDQVYPALGLP